MNQNENSTLLDAGDALDQENKSVEEIKEKIIGEFKPKRKFLNFVSVVNRSRVRLISDIAFLKGEKITGIGLDGVIFKLTICDEGTVNLEEVDTTITDKAYRQRIIDDISSMDVTGYTKKFVVSEIEFADKDGVQCYLEVEYDKPIDKLMSIFDDPKSEVSEKGMGFLNDLLGDVEDEADVEDSQSDNKITEEVKSDTDKTIALSMMREAFEKMNEDKINELKDRIGDKEKDIQKYKKDISFNEAKLKESSDQIGVLNTRLETMYPGDPSNGYVFFVSEEKKNGIEADELTKENVQKICQIMGLNNEVILNLITKGFFNIKIAKSGEIDKQTEGVDKEIYEKIISIDPMGKFTILSNSEFEYRGDLNWHQLVSKMIRKGFEQDPEFDKISGSNSYESKEEENSKEKCSHENCECDDKSIENLNMIEKFNNFDEGEEIKEAKKEYEETMGYPVGNDFIFSISSDPSGISSNGFVLAIQPKSYWDNEGCQYDQHTSSLINLPGFDEMMESTFEYDGSDVDAIKSLVNLGVKFDKNFQNFMSQQVPPHNINGMSTEQYILTNHPNSII